ncbi:MAG: hypothetical protein AAFW73_08585 [Bacteroidota bacterium]
MDFLLLLTSACRTVQYRITDYSGEQLLLGYSGFGDDAPEFTVAVAAAVARVLAVGVWEWIGFGSQRECVTWALTKPTAMQRYCYCLLCLALLGGACKTTQYTPANFPDGQLIFGSGGGITGSYTFYVLLENGQLFKRLGGDNYQALTRISAAAARKLFVEYRREELGQVDYDEPDNLSYFLEYQSAAGVHRIVWGGAARGLPPAAQDLYRALDALVQPLPQ